jgi:hypothetical protein
MTRSVQLFPNDFTCFLGFQTQSYLDRGMPYDLECEFEFQFEFHKQHKVQRNRVRILRCNGFNAKRTRQSSSL